MKETAGRKASLEITKDETECGVLKEMIWDASVSGDKSIAVSTLKILHGQAMEDAGYPMGSDFADRAGKILLQSQLNLLDQAIQAHHSPYGEDAENIGTELYLSIRSAREFMKYIAAGNGAIAEHLDDLYWGHYAKAALEFGLVNDGEEFFERAAGPRPEQCEGPEPGPERAARDIFLQGERNVRSYDGSVWTYRGMEAFLRAGRDLSEYQTVIRNDRDGWSELAMHPPCSDAAAAATARTTGNILRQQKTLRGAAATRSLPEGEQEMNVSSETAGTEPPEPETNRTNTARYSEQRLQTVLGLNEKTARYAARRTLEVLGLP